MRGHSRCRRGSGRRPLTRTRQPGSRSIALAVSVRPMQPPARLDQQPNHPVQAHRDVPMPRGGAVVAPARLEVGAEAVPVTLRLGTAQRHFGVAIGAPEQRRGQPVAANRRRRLRLPLLPRRIGAAVVAAKRDRDAQGPPAPDSSLTPLR